MAIFQAGRVKRLRNAETGLYNADMTNELIPPDYQAFLQSIKTRVQQAQLNALVAVNRELILLYWQIGRAIWSGKKSRDGEQRLSTGCQKIYTRCSPR